MAAWRRKFISQFPDLRLDATSIQYTPYSAFFDLLPRCRTAHECGDSDELISIYGYAEWCLNQKSMGLWNPAGVCFYEHLFDMPRSMWPDIVPWLSPEVVSGCKNLWEMRLPAHDIQRIDEMFESRQIMSYLKVRDHVNST